MTPVKTLNQIERKGYLIEDSLEITQEVIGVDLDVDVDIEEV